MPDFLQPDVEALASTLEQQPAQSPSSDKGRFFNYTWWPAHRQEVVRPVLKAISKMDDPAFDKRVNIMRAIERVDAKDDGATLADMGFTPTEMTRYATRALNKLLRPHKLVIRNQKLTPLMLEHKPT